MVRNSGCQILDFACWVIFMHFFFHLLTFFKINLKKNILNFQEHYLSVKQFGSRSGPTLIWVQTNSKNYQQMSKVAASKERFNVTNAGIQCTSSPIKSGLF